MKLPKFILGDHSDYPDDIFVVHTEYPRFIINLKDDEVTWFEDLVSENEEELAIEMANLVEQAGKFYDNQVHLYEQSSTKFSAQSDAE